MLYRKPSILCLALLAAGAVAGCASTKIVSTWRDPALTGPLDFQRTLVVAHAPDRYSQNVAEDTIVERMGATRAVAAHDVFSDAERRDRQKLKEEFAKGLFDGVVTIGIVGSHHRVGRGTPAGGEEPFYAYYDRAAALAAHDYPQESETVYRVETRIYTVRDERLVWSAMTDTVNPRDARTIVTDVAKAVGAELRKQKLVR